MFLYFFILLIEERIRYITIMEYLNLVRVFVVSNDKITISCPIKSLINGS